MSTTYNCVHYDGDLMRSCIYGLAVGDALAGVYYRFEAIPPKWVGQLRGKAVIDQCI